MQFRDSIWEVFTGRKDGKVSNASEAARDLPSASSNYTTLRQLFARNGLNVIDHVALIIRYLIINMVSLFLYFLYIDV